MDWLIGLGWFSLAVVVFALVGVIAVLRWLVFEMNKDIQFLDYDEDE